MKTEITIKQKIDIRPIKEGVFIEKITEDDENITIESKFNTEFYDFGRNKTINLKGNSVVLLNKNDFIKNNYLLTKKNILSCKLDTELPIEYAPYENLVFESVTSFRYKFI